MDSYVKQSYEPSRPQSATRLTDLGTPAHNVMEGASDPYQNSEQKTAEDTTKIGEAYGKATEKVRDSYDKARSYSHENPGRLIFIALGIGVGVGLLLGANSHHYSRTSHIAQPVVNVLSDIATKFFR